VKLVQRIVGTIEVGLATVASLLIAVGSILTAAASQLTDVAVFGIAPEDWAQVSGLAMLAMIVGRYLQGALREYRNGPVVVEREPADVDPTDG
jgi:TRAP-type C4-dicarboxylate transport system permease small subunit